MKTTVKITAIVSLLTLGLASPSWAHSPRGKLSYTPIGEGYFSGSGTSSNHVWFTQVGPRGKM